MADGAAYNRRLRSSPAAAVGHVTISPVSATGRLDGRAVPGGSIDVPLDGLSHVLEIEAAGFVTRTMELAPGEAPPTTVELIRVPPVAPREAVDEVTPVVVQEPPPVVIDEPPIAPPLARPHVGRPPIDRHRPGDTRVPPEEELRTSR